MSRNPESSVRRTHEIEEWTNLYFVHPLSRRFVNLFARLGVRPNAVSLFGMAFGIAAGVAYSNYEIISATMAGFIFMVAWHVMDGADGQLARLTGHASEVGKILDGISDHTAFTAVYVGLGVGLTPEHGPAVWLLVVAAGMSHFLQATVYERQRQSYDYWGRGKASCRLMPPEEYRQKLEARRGLARHFGRLYVGYLRAQQRVAVHDPRLDESLEMATADEIEGSEVRRLYREMQVRPVRRWSILSSNYRTIAVFLACLSGQPLFFFLFEIVGLNSAFIALHAMQRRANRRTRKEISARLAVGVSLPAEMSPAERMT